MFPTFFLCKRISQKLLNLKKNNTFFKIANILNLSLSKNMFSFTLQEPEKSNLGSLLVHNLMAGSHAVSNMIQIGNLYFLDKINLISS